MTKSIICMVSSFDISARLNVYFKDKSKYLNIHCMYSIEYLTKHETIRETIKVHNKDKGKIDQQEKTVPNPSYLQFLQS